MQNKGLVIVIAVLMTLASIFYLSFSVATHYYDRQAAKIKDPIAQQDYKDSVRYLGIYSYQKCLETQIGLGLDLKGGMNVILEISVPDVVEKMADHSSNMAFQESMREAKIDEETSQSDFISLFVRHFHQNAPGHRLAEIFSTQALQGKVSSQSSDADVIKVLRDGVQSAIDNSFNVVRTRIDKFGVVQPNIQKLEGQQGRIMVEMPGVNEPERIRKLLQGSANLEFWETYNANDIIPYLTQIDQRLANNGEGADTAKVETAAKAETASPKAAEPKFKLKGATDDTGAGVAQGTEAQEAAAKKLHPLLSMLQTTQGQLAMTGLANVRDTAAINRIIYSAMARQVLPSDVRLLWGAKPTDLIKGSKNIYELYAIKVTSTDGRAPLEGDVVTDAKDEFNSMTGTPEVSMTMNSDGARRWAALTKANIGKAIAIVLDGVVYSAPRVNSEIDGGQSSISGNFTIEDTKDLANTLKSGRMPAPARIVQEDVVGPTLGAQSIQQGVISFVIAFVLLMVYMVFMYGFIPGMIANGALLVNLFFTLGILTSFQAALTMSGIAGIVLTLGIAVDANVLIYERIKEELRAGKGMKDAVSLGHKHAFTAIFDSMLTSLITGAILYLFGTGPIRGFATTLILGELSSFFTAVYLTHLVFQNRFSKGKWLNLKYTTRYASNFLQNKSFRFMSTYKTTFTVVGVIIVLCVISFVTRGFSKSIDFTGGRNYVVAFEKPVEPEQVRSVIANAFPGCTTSVLSLGTDHKTIRISTNYKIASNNPTVDDEAEAILYKALKTSGFVTQKNLDSFKNPDMRGGGAIISSTKVGPSVAKDIANGAVLSVIFALIAIFLYILLRFRNVAFSLGSVIGLAVDTVIVLGVYSALWGILPFSLEIDQTFIGAVLTVIGYSMHDKVVVFDRIRENLKLHRRQDHQSLYNDSINETLARTINTSSATLLVLLCILFFGGESIRSFAFAMVLGVILGTLSSIFISSPIAYLVQGKKIEEDVKPEVSTAKA